MNEMRDDRQAYMEFRGALDAQLHRNIAIVQMRIYQRCCSSRESVEAKFNGLSQQGGLHSKEERAQEAKAFIEKEIARYHACSKARIQALRNKYLENLIKLELWYRSTAASQSEISPIDEPLQ